MTRLRIPYRRQSENITFHHAGHKYTATVSRDRHGLLREIFLDAAHPGSALAAMARMPPSWPLWRCSRASMSKPCSIALPGWTMATRPVRWASCSIWWPAMYEPFSIEDQDQATSDADKGRLRWRAIEAANSAPDLSPMARRVLVALICMMDSKTRACFPSELKVAEFLGVHETSVKKAKAELRDEHHLIHWTNPNGPRHQSHYVFNWHKLIRLSEEAKVKSEKAVAVRKSGKRSQGSRVATMETPFQGSHTATMEAPRYGSRGYYERRRRPFQSSQFASQGSRFAIPR